MTWQTWIVDGLLIGSLAGILLFGGVLVWGLADLISCRKRRADLNIPESNQKTSGAMTFATMIVGFITWTPFAHIAYGIVRI